MAPQVVHWQLISCFNLPRCPQNANGFLIKIEFQVFSFQFSVGFGGDRGWGLGFRGTRDTANEGGLFGDSQSNALRSGAGCLECLECLDCLDCLECLECLDCLDCLDCLISFCFSNAFAMLGGRR